MAIAKNEGRKEVELVEKLVAINRVAKVVKGGRRFGFAALMVVGDGNGRVGFGAGKANEVPEAIRKASKQAKLKMISVALKEKRTIHHDVTQSYGSGRLIMRTAQPGTGIIAGGPVRAIFEALGVNDVVAKSLRSTNPHNLVRAAFKCLESLQSPKHIAFKRDKKIGEIINSRDLHLSKKQLEQAKLAFEKSQLAKKNEKAKLFDSDRKKNNYKTNPKRKQNQQNKSFVKDGQNSNVTKEAVADKAVADKAVAEKSVAEKSVADKAVADKAVADKAVADKAVADKAVAEKSVADKAVAEKSVADKAVAEKSVADKAVISAEKVAKLDKVAKVEKLDKSEKVASSKDSKK